MAQLYGRMSACKVIDSHRVRGCEPGKIMLKTLPTTTSGFRKIITGDYVYVDKTKYIYQLVQHPTGAWFLSRPRRFGKSLLLSTLEELLRGNRELFRGLWIDSSDYRWQTYPVIRLDFGQEPIKTAEELKETIDTYLDEVAINYGVTLAAGPYYRRFRHLIQKLASQEPEKQVVILIDEYDKPLLDNLSDLPEAKKIRDTLKGFYGVIKAMDRYIRLSFITGISKFSKVGVFSDLNNLTDLTMNTAFATALGLTEAEIRQNLAGYISQFAQKEAMTEAAFLDKLRHWYDGFCFAPEAENVYNPFSTMHLFYHQRFANYWFESGTPTFLIKLIHQRNYNIEQVSEMELGELAFSTYDIENLAIVPLLFQTGYLTLKSYEPTFQRYRLGYPNYEVENAFLIYLLDAFSNTQQGFSEAHLWRLIDALKAHDLPLFFTMLKALFANIDYDLHLDYEKYYQTIFYLIFKLIGVRIDAEVRTNDGRIDAVVELDERIYLFEFKLDKDATVALQQIQDHAYYQKYQLRGKPITCVGANFNATKRMIDDWKTEEVMAL